MAALVKVLSLELDKDMLTVFLSTNYLLETLFTVVGVILGDRRW